MKNGKQGKYIKLLTMAILVTLTENTVLAADTSEIIIDKSNGKAPMVTTAGNGVPVINIQKPNSRGLSHNQYKSFNVGQKGIIFNNTMNGTNVKTQLGGYIMGNANITTQTAKTILNEVTSNTASKINGFMEIAGQKANLIISNPNGIQIGNSGYINVNRGILTTGKPQIGADGNLNGFKVDRGKIIIDNFGFDATATSSAEIYAQAVQINAKLCAENLNVITGKNTIDSNGNIAEVTDDTGYVGVSLDVGRLGGMYAGVIKLIGTAKGVGVNTDGEIYAQRQLTLDENGKIVVTENGKVIGKESSKILSKGQLFNAGEMTSETGTLEITANGIENSGKISSVGKGIIVSDGDTINTGEIIAQEDIDIRTAGLMTDTIATAGNLNITAKGNITNTRQIQSGSNINIVTDEEFVSDGIITSMDNLSVKAVSIQNTGKITTGGYGKFTATDTFHNQAEIITNNDMEITAGSFVNDSNLTSSDNFSLTTKNSYTNNVTITAGKDLQIQSAGLITNGELLSGKTSTLIADGDFINNGKIATDGDIVILADSISNAQDKTIMTKGASTITGSKGDFINNGSVISEDLGIYNFDKGTVENNGSMKSNSKLNVTAKNITNAGNMAGATEGKYNAEINIINTGLFNGKETVINAGVTFNNEKGGRVYGDDIFLTSQNINNVGLAGTTETPIIAARNNLMLTAENGIVNNKENADILALNDVIITAKVLNNDGSTINADNDLKLNVETVNNTNQHFAYERQVIDRKYGVKEFAIEGKTTRYRVGTGTGEYTLEPTHREYGEGTKSTGYDIWYVNDDDDAYALHTPGGTSTEWYEYNFNSLIEADVIVSTQPGIITSGRDIIYNGVNFINDKSKVIAGKTLTVTAGNISNIDQKGKQYITDTGNVTRYYKGDHGHGHDHIMVTKSSTDSYSNYYEPTITVLAAEKLAGGTVTAVDGSIITANNKNTIDLSGAKTAENIVNKNNIAEGLANAITLSSVYTLAKPNAQYYIETDPEFADFNSWLSSDYFFEKQNTDPDKLAKRLGDAYYEQNKIKEQVINLTGSRYLDGYTSDEQQYRDLMDNAIGFANQTGLVIGTAPNQEQLNKLTEPMIWMELQNVRLPSGETVLALAPELYLPKNYNTGHSNAVISGINVNLLAETKLTNTGDITAKEKVTLEGNNIANIYGLITGKDIRMDAKENILNEGGTIIAEKSADITAGKDIIMKTTTSTAQNPTGSSQSIDKVANLQVTGEKANINLKAGRNVELTAAEISATGSNAGIDIEAGKNINLTTVESYHKENLKFKDGYRKEHTAVETGTGIFADGKLNIKAGETLDAKAADITADEIDMTAGENINLETGKATTYLSEYLRDTNRGTLSTKTKIKLDTTATENSIATNISGNQINIKANNNINIKGSNIIGTGDVNLTAEENINITADKNTITETHYSKTTKSGLLSGGGFGVTIGKQKTTDDLNSKTQYLTGSTIGSIKKDINITAGNKADINAGDIIAGGNINITGSEVAIKAGQENHTYNYKHEESMQGLSISLGGGVVGTVQENIVQPLERSRQISNNKLKALYDIKAASKIKETGEEIKNAIKDGNKADWGHINVGISNSKSTYKEHGESSTAHSSNITANKDISITALEKDINIKGSNVKGENITLTAKGNVNIEANENTSKFNSKETQSGKSAGASFSIYGTSAYANAYGTKEKGEGTTITYTGSKVTANNELNINTGKDTNIIGSKARGDKVTANIGGNLNIESLQETEKQKYETNSYGASGSIGLSGNIDGKGGFNFNASTNEMDSDYKSVIEQAGIYAGSRGFDITVDGNTDLKGAVIDSTAGADKNTLNTGTITFSDIENKAEYDTKGYGFSYSELANREKEQDGRPVMQGDKGLIPAIPMASGDEAESSTKSAVADGTITIRNKDKQKQDINELKRNTKDTLNKLDKIFDKDKIEEKQELAGQFSELAFNAIHNLSQKKVVDENGKEKIVGTWTEDQKVLAHALVGYVSGELANSKNSFSTAFTAGVNKFVTEEILKDEKTYKHYQEHPEELQWISAALGSAIGQMAGGDATSGASISASGTKNNLFWEYIPQLRDSLKNEDMSNLKPWEVKVYNFNGGAGIVNASDIALVLNSPNKDVYSGFSVGAGASLLPVDVAVYTGHVIDAKGNLVTDINTIKKALSGFSMGSGISGFYAGAYSGNPNSGYTLKLQGVDSNLGINLVNFGFMWNIGSLKKGIVPYDFRDIFKNK